jgi:hypothetical protein
MGKILNVRWISIKTNIHNFEFHLKYDGPISDEGFFEVIPWMVLLR